MKKMFTTALGLSSMIALAQGNPNEHYGRVGINTMTPKATLEISKNPLETNEKRPQGVLFPSFSSDERAKFEQVTEGMMIYNKAKQCLEIYAGNPAQWSCITTLATGGNGGGGNGGYVVGQGAIPAGVTLNGNSHFITSIYDNNYLPYTAPTSAATVGVHNADGTNEPTAINVAGVIPANGIAVQIPITATSSGIITGSTFEATIQAIHTKGAGNTDAGSVPRKVILTWQSTAVDSSYKSITAYIKPADGQEIQLRRLDLNNGIGNDGKGIKIASFSYKSSNDVNAQSSEFSLHAIAGIPDKKFGVQTNGKLEHQFIYIPMQGPDGKLWLNNNLGAEYANITSPYFNPMRQAGALDYTDTTINAPKLNDPTADQIKKDWRAYGYLYEWGRDSDGHEVIKWTFETQGSFANVNLHNYNNHNVAYSKSNDPCPSGFHTPTESELRTLHGAILGTIAPSGTNNSNSDKLWNERDLRLSAAGHRLSNNATLGYQGVHGWYWSSTEHSSTNGWYLSFNASNSLLNTGYDRTRSFPVRCIADN